MSPQQEVLERCAFCLVFDVIVWNKNESYCIRITYYILLSEISIYLFDAQDKVK
jgi:hypothetical protein